MDGGVTIMRDAIQRELEKEMIREKIIREEVERFSVLEDEVRRELMIGREIMAMQISRGDQSFTTSFPNVSKKEGVKPKPPAPSLPAAAVSTELKVWTCPICEISAPCESGFLDHLAGKKHKAITEAAVCSTDLTKKKFEWRCPICKVNPPCERGLVDHLAGKKHRAKVAGDSTELKPYRSKKMIEWRCPICKISAPCESGFLDHLAGKKHQAISEAAAGSTELIKKKMEWRCPICEVSATCERGFQEHLAGKKHLAKVRDY